MDTIDRIQGDGDSLINLLKDRMRNRTLLFTAGALSAVLLESRHADLTRIALQANRVLVLADELIAHGVLPSRIVEGVQIVDFDEQVTLASEVDETLPLRASA